MKLTRLASPACLLGWVRTGITGRHSCDDQIIFLSESPLSFRSTHFYLLLVWLALPESTHLPTFTLTFIRGVFLLVNTAVTNLLLNSNANLMDPTLWKSPHMENWNQLRIPYIISQLGRDVSFWWFFTGKLTFQNTSK